MTLDGGANKHIGCGQVHSAAHRLTELHRPKLPDIDNKLQDIANGAHIEPLNPMVKRHVDWKVGTWAEKLPSSAFNKRNIENTPNASQISRTLRTRPGKGEACVLQVSWESIDRLRLKADASMASRDAGQSRQVPSSLQHGKSSDVNTQSPAPTSTPLQSVKLTETEAASSNKLTVATPLTTPPVSPHKPQPTMTGSQTLTVGKEDTSPDSDRIVMRPRWIKGSLLKAVVDKYDQPCSDVDSNQTEDGEYDGPPRELVSYTQPIAPPPIEWDGRTPFADNRLRQTLERWNKGVPEATMIDMEHPLFAAAGRNADIALKTWIPKMYGGLSLSEWWHDQISSSLFEGDGTEKPWWELCDDNCFLQPISNPDDKVDLNDPENHADYFKNLTSATVSAEKQRKVKEQAKKRTQRRRERDNYLNQNPVWEEEEYVNPHIPKANIYLRLAAIADIPQITEIYNWYIQNALCVPDPRPLTVDVMRERYRDIIDGHLPYLVAVERTPVKQEQAQERAGYYGRAVGKQQPVNKIVGFGYCDDFNHRDGMYRHSIELELFVRENYLHQGVGKCLLDKMLGLLDLGHTERGGYDTIDVSGILFGKGIRHVGSIVVNVPYDPTEEPPLKEKGWHELAERTPQQVAADKKEEAEIRKNFVKRFDWLEPWLLSWKFEKVMDMPRFGLKHGKKINLAMFRYETDNTIE